MCMWLSEGAVWGFIYLCRCECIIYGTGYGGFGDWDMALTGMIVGFVQDGC